MTILPIIDPNGHSESIEPGRLARVLRRLEEGQVFSGAVLVARNGDVLFHEGYGWADRDTETPLARSAKLNLASLNKMFTAVAIAQLAEVQKLSYDDPIGKHLGTDWIAPDIGGKVRIEHLLSHTSRIGGGDCNVTCVKECVRRHFRRVADARILTEDMALKFAPGEQYDCSNLGYHLLGAIVESAGGEDYYGYITSHVFEPAEMANTGFDALDNATDLATGYMNILEKGAIDCRDNRLIGTVCEDLAILIPQMVDTGDL